MANSNRGRLELTWTNKDRRLINVDGLQPPYAWVPATDHRVREVRLLRDSGVVGDVHDSVDRARDNLLIRGDALHALTGLCELPEFADEYLGQVKLAYIDPPFNTGQTFEHYDDGLEHSVWLTMMRDRLVQIQRLLRPDGSVWVHLDDAEMAYCRVMMDEIFGRDKFVATIVWQKRYSRENRKAIGSAHDYILVYSSCEPSEWARVRNRLPRDAKTLKQYRNPNHDPRGPWRVLPMDAQGYRPNQMYTVTSPTGVQHIPSKGRCWGFIEPRFRELEASGRIYWGKDGNARPGIIRYLDEAEGLVPSTWWPNDEVGHTDEAKKEILSLFPNEEPFDTPKPERFLQRIITVASDPGDIVLDCFAGSGTTAAVAHKMERRWVTVEMRQETLERFTHPRLEAVVAGKDMGGITTALDWKGGGGFRMLDVAPSMYAEDDGVVVLASWATDNAFAEGVAAQLGFDYEPDGAFAGRRGRARLAVLDGLVTIDACSVLLRHLGPRETLQVVGVGVDPEVDAFLRKKRPGSRARTAPQDLLLAYQTPSSWRMPATAPPVYVAPEGGDEPTANDGAPPLESEVVAATNSGDAGGPAASDEVKA